MTDDPHPLGKLSDEDREFVLQFVLVSGSLKDLAQHYAVSYPTLRARLDKVIDRLRQLVAGRKLDPMGELLAGFVEQGQLSSAAAKRILDLHRRRIAARD